MNPATHLMNGTNGRGGEVRLEIAETDIELVVEESEEDAGADSDSGDGDGSDS